MTRIHQSSRAIQKQKIFRRTIAARRNEENTLVVDELQKSLSLQI